MTVYNFSAGPAVLPKEVLVKAQSEMLDYQQSGMSVMELSHRSSLFEEIIQTAEKKLRELMEIPENYRVLFLQGGASLQFTMVPLNLAQEKKALYVETGIWSKKAIAAARSLGNVEVEVVASSKDDQFRHIPEIKKEQIDQSAAYVHLTTNNTIAGTAFQKIPDVGDVPVVADMSSNILANDYNVKDFGLIYAGAQKNIGPAGLTVVIVREDLLGNGVFAPMLDYKLQAENGSLYNTPPTYSIYIAKLVFEWLLAKGGVSAILKEDKEKAALLYEAIDRSALFSNPIEKTSRSITNIPFSTGDAELDRRFIQAAEAQGFINLKGHRSVGGMRASLYNAFPKEGVVALIAFMKEFETSCAD